MDALGWAQCDVVLVTGDAYVDHPSFGMAVIGRVLEAHGYRVGVIAQPDWHSAEPFRALGRPRLFWGVTAGNMDSMVNRYTADRKVRNDDAYTPSGAAGARPDRAAVVYAQRCREAYRGVPVVLGGIEASLRRIGHYDYWQDKVRRSVLIDAKADLLVYGNAERAVVEIARRLDASSANRGADRGGDGDGDRAGGVAALRDIRGTAFARGAAEVKRGLPAGYVEIDSTDIDTPGRVDKLADPYAMEPDATASAAEPSAGGCAGPAAGSPGAGQIPAGAASAQPGDSAQLIAPSALRRRRPQVARAHQVIRLPSYEQVAADPVSYAHASRVLHRESNPHNARALVQTHGDREVWINPPPIPLATAELDQVFELPYQRVPHPRYGRARIPAYEMIRFSVLITRGCFGGCTFCSITEHEGRIIQNRSQASILREIAAIRDTVPGFTGVISDLGGPTANMWRLACKSRDIEAACRKPSCVYPGICDNLNTDHAPLIELYRRARAVPGVKKVLIASGLRYDLAVESPAYIKELAKHHVGGYLKIAPEHVARGPLDHMMKPGIGTYDRFKALFDRYSKQAGKKQYLIPYFIAAHPGTSDEDMLELALWLRDNDYKADQVQTYLPSPMATATAMYHSGKSPLRRVRRDGGDVEVPRGLKVRRLHKAFLRWHAPESWPILRPALRRMGRGDLIGRGPRALVPPEDTSRGERRGGAERGRRAGAAGDRDRRRVVAERSSGSRRFRTQHTGLPPLPEAEPGAAGERNARRSGDGRGQRGAGEPRAGGRSSGRGAGRGSGAGGGRRRKRGR